MHYCTFNLLLQGRGFSKAMTAKEAQAFVGDVSCLVNTLQDDKLFLDPPPTPPRARSRRHRRDTRPELLDLMVRDKDRQTHSGKGSNESLYHTVKILRYVYSRSIA